jgi:antitoxin (DNA-binding transcriptional repressor) of toxin-antitoxin stability system
VNTLISAKQLRSSLPQVVKKVQRGGRFTVLYRSRPVFQIVPMGTSDQVLGDLLREPRESPVCRYRRLDGLRGRSRPGAYGSHRGA